MADVTEHGDESDVGVVQALPILSSELVDEDFDSSLRFSLDPRLFDSSFSTCLIGKKARNQLFFLPFLYCQKQDIQTFTHFWP